MFICKQTLSPLHNITKNFRSITQNTNKSDTLKMLIAITKDLGQSLYVCYTQKLVIYHKLNIYAHEVR